MKMLRTISRMIVGLVFIFSGFVKGLDPMGTMFKIEDYFIAYGTEWALPVALSLSIFLCSLEFIIGVYLVLNVRIKIATWLMLLVMAGFTIMTFFDAIYNPVPDCGCFGDAVILTNWQTFYKNLVLMVFVLILVFTHRLSKPKLSIRAQNITALTVILLIAGFTVYSSNRIPVIDFREWKVGTDITPGNAGEPVTYLIYRNDQTGETQELLSGDLPWQDSVWMSQWKFVDTRIDDSHVIKAHNLQIIDTSGIDVTANFVKNPGYQFFLISWDLSEANKKVLKKVNEFFTSADAAGYSFIMLTCALPGEINQFAGEYHAHYEIYNADDIVLKTMIRSNPGLMLLKDGVILQKWHFHYFPSFEDIKYHYAE